MAFQLNYQRIGTKIKDGRKAANLTQAQLAEKCGYSTSYISNIEGGNFNMSLKVLVSICEELHLDISDVLGLYVETGVSEDGAILLRRLKRVLANATPQQFRALNSFLVEASRLYLESLVAADYR